ncbi:MAG: secretin N-terminal domain-containing protein [Betaproteobacteria bacterium]
MSLHLAFPSTPRPARACLALAIALALSSTAANARTRAPAAKPETFTVDLPNIDIDAAARAIATILDRPVVVDPRVKGQVTLFSDQPVTRTQAFLLFQAAMRGAGDAVIESGGLLKVVPEAEAKLQTGVLRLDGAAHAGDAVETQVFRLANESAANLVGVLRPLISANNTINANAGNNTLVITDYASNLQRLGALIAALDTPSATDVEVIPLENALAADLAAQVLRLSDPGATSGGAGAGGGGAAAGSATGSVAANGLAVIADPHTNALLVKGATPARLAAIRALVARMDRPGAARSNIHVVYLQYTDATRLATVLRAAFASDASRVGASNGGGGSTTPLGGAGGGPTAAATSGSSSSSDTASAQSTAAVTGAAAPSIGGFIQADPASNALIVTAAEPLYRELRAAIADLDTRRAQLVVESVVVEVDASKALDVGLQWKQIFNIAADTTLTLGTVAQAIQATSGTNILSTANLVTLDNEEAKIVVGQNVPFVTGSYTSSSSSTTNPFQTIERKDVGITLRIRPQIGANGTVRMAIYQESSSVASTAATGTESAGPTTNKRAIETNVVVDDGKIIVLGGLIEDSDAVDREQIPLLSRIPYVGALFRNVSHTRKRTNLLVFLRPVIMRDAATAHALTMDRYDYIRALQKTAPELPPGIDNDTGVTLPADPAAPFRPR